MTKAIENFKLLALKRNSQVVDNLAESLQTVFSYDCITMGLDIEKFKKFTEIHSESLKEIGEIPDIPKFKPYIKPIEPPLIMPDFRILNIFNENLSLCIYHGLALLFTFFELGKRESLEEGKECLFFWRYKPSLSYNEIKNKYCFTARIGILKEKKEILEKVFGKGI